MNRSEAHAVFFCKLFNLTMWCEGISWGGRDMDQVVSVPVGIHPEPVCSTVVDFSPSRVGYSEHHYSAASWSLMLPWKNSQLKDWNQCTDKHCIRHTVNQVRQACLKHGGAVLCWLCSVLFEITKWRAICFLAPSAGEKGTWLSCEHWDLLGDGKCHFLPVKWKTWNNHLKVFLYSIA